MVKKWFLLVLSGSAKNNWHNINNKYSYQKQKIPCSLCRRVLHFTIFFLLLISNIHLSINSSSQPLINSSTVYAFDSGFPKLVWEKEYPFKITDVKLADSSGDVLLSNSESDQLILIDPQGNERLHLGPSLNGILGIDGISSDGTKIMYSDDKGKDIIRNIDGLIPLRTHFITRKNEKIWEKDLVGRVLLSPGTDWYVVNNLETIKSYDISGKLLWEKITSTEKLGYEEDVEQFSLDSNYIIGGVNIHCGSGIYDEDIVFRTYDRQGKKVWEEKFKSNRFGYSGIAEITKAGYVVWNYKDYHKIYDYLGNIVTEIPNGVKRAFISLDGKAVIYQYDTSFQVLNLSDKSLIMDGKLNFFEAKLSNEGKYLVGLRKLTIDMQENIIIYDTQNKSMWKTKIGGDISNDLLEKSKCFQESYTHTILKSDGRYLLVIKEGNKHLYYYQLY